MSLVVSSDTLILILFLSDQTRPSVQVHFATKYISALKVACLSYWLYNALHFDLRVAPTCTSPDEQLEIIR